VLASNLTDYDFQLFYLVRAGYGSVSEIEQMDTEQFYNALEYEQIRAAVIDHSRPKK
jgi:hypothetical protein